MTTRDKDDVDNDNVDAHRDVGEEEDDDDMTQELRDLEADGIAVCHPR